MDNARARGISVCDIMSRLTQALMGVWTPRIECKKVLLMKHENILTEVRGRVGIITLNQPDRLNPMSNKMQREKIDQVREWNNDDSVGAIVITGAGRGFCSGADIAKFEAAVHNGLNEVPLLPADVEWLELARDSKPIVCAINGVAVGLGVTFTLPCDIRVASSEARFSFRFAAIGLTPEYGSTHYLPQLIGMGKAMEFMLSARFVEAQEALDAGLVNYVYPPEEMLEKAVELAQQIAENPDWQLRKIKRLMHENYMERDLSLVVRHERETFRESQGTEAHKEALLAFRERRKPNFHTDHIDEDEE